MDLIKGGRGFYISHNMKKSSEPFGVPNECILADAIQIVKKRGGWLQVHSNQTVSTGSFSNSIFWTVSGTIYSPLYEQKVEDILTQVLKTNKLEGLGHITGDYILCFGNAEKIILYNHRASQYPVFWRASEGRFEASNYDYFIVGPQKINNERLGMLCASLDINIYNDLQVMNSNQALIITKDTVIIKENVLHPSRRNIPKLTSLADYGAYVYEMLKESVKECTDGKKKCVLMLSGGIDSASIARCLYDLNVDTTFYTWACHNNDVSELQFSQQIATMFGKEIIPIYLDTPPYNNVLPRRGAKHYPYQHNVTAWWEHAFEKASEENADLMISGHYGGLFGTRRNIKEVFPFNRVALKYSYHTKILYEQMLQNLIIPYRWLAMKKKKEQRRSTNEYRWYDIFTDEIMYAIRQQEIYPDAPYMLAQDYSYKVNLADSYGIDFAIPLLSEKILDFVSSLPPGLRNVQAQGFNINKITLRYSMINRLPFDVVSRCYCANLDYIANDQLKNHLDSIFLLLSDTYSCLAQRRIVDVKKIDCLREAGFEKIAKYRTALTTSAMIEQWLRQLPNNVVTHQLNF